MKGVSRVGFSSEMGIIQGEFAGAAGRRCNLYSTGQDYGDRGPQKALNGFRRAGELSM
jgi:hypothetical protein